MNAQHGSASGDLAHQHFISWSVLKCRRRPEQSFIEGARDFDIWDSNCNMVDADDLMRHPAASGGFRPGWRDDGGWVARSRGSSPQPVSTADWPILFSGLKCDRALSTWRTSPKRLFVAVSEHIC
jgi:hypothetical protein